jgi:hypothetical protein
MVLGLDDKAVDRGLEVDEGAEHASFQASFRQLGEEALDGIEPGHRFWCVIGT